MAAASQSPEPPRPVTTRSGSLLAGALTLLIAAMVAMFQAPHPDAYGGKTWRDWLTKPIEFNAPNRLLKVEGAIHDIAFTDGGRRGFAVGEGGLVLATEDGGRNWRVAARDERQRALRAVAISPKGAAVVAVGDGGSGFASIDRGTTWQAVPSIPDNSLVAVPKLATDGAFLTITGNGVAFLWRPSSAENTLALIVPGGSDMAITTAAFSSDGETGWAGGSGGLVYETRDGGSTWYIPGDFSSDFPDTKASALDPAFQSRPTLQPANYTPRVLGNGLRFAPLEDSSGSKQQPPYPEAKQPGDGASTSKAPVGTSTPEPLPNQPITRSTRQARSAKPPPKTPVIPPRGKGPEVESSTPALSRVPTIPDPGPSESRAPEPVTAPIQRLLAFEKEPVLAGLRKPDTFVRDMLGNPDAGVSVWDDNAAALDLAFAGERRGWLVGERGRIATTGDGGARWSTQQSRVSATLNAIAVSQDGTRLWAAGEGGTLIASTDGGQTWFRQLRDTSAAETGGSYWRFPAPGFYAALAAALGLLVQGARPVPAKIARGAAAIGASDAPTASMDQDRLGFAALARGISRYLRNKATTPPMTIAVAGDWGTGKSSLMQLVCEDLRSHGNRPVWFNAWHHQDEEQLLAALLAAIRDKALPHWWTPAGLQFRAHLFWLRASRKLPTTLFLVGLIAALAAYFTTHNVEAWGPLGQFFTSLFGDGGKDAVKPDGAQLGGSLAKVLAPLAALFAVIRGLRGALKAFGTDPAVLLTSTIDNFKMRDASAQVNFRTRFQVQFDEVTTALPYPLVIVIDDLDRCRPETVLSVMESVNFLMSSGPCFVMFGMATQRVQAALAMSFKEIALELVVGEETGGLPTGEDREKVAREKRQKYAGDYLQKLINLEIRVPTRADIAPHLLLIQSGEQVQPHWLREAVSRIAKFWPLVPVALVIAAAWSLGSNIDLGKPEQAKTVASREAAREATQGSATADPAVQPPARAVPTGPLPSGAENTRDTPRVKVTPGEGGGRTDWPLFALLGLHFAGFAVWQYGRKRERNEVRDSDAFIDALEIWTPVVAHKASAPRAIKRFGNRLRYFAMLQQAEVPEPTPEERAEAWLRQWLPGGEGEGDPSALPQVDTVAEHRIVALGALQSVYGDAWRERIEKSDQQFSEGFAKASDGPVDESWLAQEALTDKALENYATATGTSWPPSPEELDAFERSVKGIRLGGDARILSDRKPVAASPPPPPRPRTKK